MEIVNFFETLAGKWFSQRTTHYVAAQTSRAGQSNLEIDFLDAADPALSATGVQSPLCGLRIHQDSRMDGDTQSVKTSSLMVISSPTDSSGELVVVSSSGQSLSGCYSFEAEVLTLTTPTAAGHAEERLWFISPNLRMRTSVLRQDDAVQSTSFCSEIRMGLTRPAPSA